MKIDMNTFIELHLSISKERFAAETAKGSYKDKRHPETLNVLEIEPDHDMFALLLRCVGSPYGWPQRPQYAEDNRINMVKYLSRPQTRLFLLRNEKQVMGFCLTSIPDMEEDMLHMLGYKKEDISPFTPQVVEIDKFGLFPEHTGNKYGQYFLPALMEELFKTHETVYLNTRSTNHNGVLPFYSRLGVEVFTQKVLPNDLLPETDIGVIEKVA